METYILNRMKSSQVRSVAACGSPKTRPDLLFMRQRVHSGCEVRRVVGSGQSVQWWLPADEQGIACQVLSGAGTDDNNRSTSPRFSGGAGRSDARGGADPPTSGSGRPPSKPACV